MSKDRAMKDVIRAAKPGMVVVMTIQDFKEIVEDVAKHLLLLQPIITMNPTTQIIDPFVQNNERSELEKKEANNEGCRQAEVELNKESNDQKPS